MITTADGHIFRYWVDQDELLKAACERLPMNMTWDNWQRYFPGQGYDCTCPDLPPHPTFVEARDEGLASLAEGAVCAAVDGGTGLAGR